MHVSPAPSRQTIDIRTMGPCGERKACVLRAFDELTAGESLQVVNDHLPNGLLRHFEELRPGAFEWTVLESGPDVYRVQIRKPVSQKA